jgi:hypothetical protein
MEEVIDSIPIKLTKHLHNLEARSSKSGAKFGARKVHYLNGD